MNVCIIPARGGSVRVPRKNVADFRGKPMLCHAIDIAKASNAFQLIVVSTDDDEIEEVALKSGAVVIRRPTDDGVAGTQEIARRALLNLPAARFACVLYPCSPLLHPYYLRKGMHAMQQYCFAMSVGPDGQDAGCFYWGDVPAFLDSLPLDAPHTARIVLPAERVCDINTHEDMERAGRMYDALREMKPQPTL